MEEGNREQFLKEATLVKAYFVESLDGRSVAAQLQIGAATPDAATARQEFQEWAGARHVDWLPPEQWEQDAPGDDDSDNGEQRTREEH